MKSCSAHAALIARAENMGMALDEVCCCQLLVLDEFGSETLNG
jgi:hypothetical protein